MGQPSMHQPTPACQLFPAEAIFPLARRPGPQWACGVNLPGASSARSPSFSGNPGTPKRLLGIVDPSIEPDWITESRGSVRRKEFLFASSPRNAPMRAAGGNAICTHRVRGNGVDESLTSPFLPARVTHLAQ